MKWAFAVKGPNCCQGAKSPMVFWLSKDKGNQQVLLNAYLVLAPPF
jgi:hypothetical protein